MARFWGYFMAGMNRGLGRGLSELLNALIKQSNSHKRAVLDYLRKVHFKPLVNL